MIKRTYKLPNGNFETKGPCKGVLTNSYGSYYAIDNESSYQGWHVLQTKSWRLQKTIESLTPLQEGECTEISHQGFNIQRTFESGAKDVVALYQNTLMYTMLGMRGPLRLTLDHREAYDPSELGRNYEIVVEENFILISFRKEGKDSYKHFIGIKGIKKAMVLDSWREAQYDENKKRGIQSNYWVYDALDLIPRNHVVFSSATSASEARVLADIAYYHFDEILSNVHHNSDKQLFSDHSIKYEDTKVAAYCAANSLLALTQVYSFDHRLTKGILAGLPWFFQLWSRDELISLGGLLSLASHKDHKYLIPTIKTIISRHMRSIKSDGTLPNRFPKAKLGSIDALGWLAKRAKEFITLLRNNKNLYNIISPKELVFWKQQLLKALEKSKELHQNEEGLFENDSCQTWMDTSFQDDGREGVRIEIQALFYSVYDSLLFIELIVNNESNIKLYNEQQEFKKKIRSKFIRDDFAGLVVDGYNKKGEPDYAYRPNIFLALYISPKLFKRSEKKTIVDKYIEELLMPWGGLATLPPDHKLYQANHTGQDDRSYHRGDSWYFVNNIAAIVLEDIDFIKYKPIIKKIQLASVNDILQDGYMGAASEISSASVQEAKGCLAQAWSAATFVELMNILYNEEE